MGKFIDYKQNKKYAYPFYCTDIPPPTLEGVLIIYFLEKNITYL